MKIEKISDNQMRFTLTKEDLEERNIKLSEFAYGSEKAKKLLGELMEEAEQSYGFIKSEDVPIVVEAIPTSANSLVMIVTRVDNPDELDTRFSRFTPYAKDAEEGEELNEPKGEAFSDVKLDEFENKDADFFNEVLRELKNIKESMDDEEKNPGKPVKRLRTIRRDNTFRSFQFRSLDDAAKYASIVAPEYNGRSDLYKDTSERSYYLVLFLRNMDAEVFNRSCNIACEFSRVMKNGSLSYYSEYYKRIAKGDAIEKLALLNIKK